MYEALTCNTVRKYVYNELKKIIAASVVADYSKVSPSYTLRSVFNKIASNNVL